MANMVQPVITLTTDFGFKDPYVAEMKGVILSICPDAGIVDMSHHVEKFNVRTGAYVLASASSYFPVGTVHVAVVDPGVGTRRRCLCVQTRRGFLVGPDNGVLALAARAEGLRQAYEITNRKYMLANVSGTFHGRDVFAPAAAHLANGIPPSDLGEKIRRIVVSKFAKVLKTKEGISGEVLHVDDFGNIITNIGEHELAALKGDGILDVRIGRSRFMLKFCKTYGEVGHREPVGLAGSHGFLEISVNQGNAAKLLGVRSGDNIMIYRS